MSTLNNTVDELASALNCYQMHAECPRPVCERKDKDTGETVCRFFFGQPNGRKLRTEAVVNRDLDHRNLRFQPIRNNGWVNNLSKIMVMAWLANTDIQPGTNLQGLKEYLAKYCSKSEPTTKSYRELRDIVMLNVSSREPALSLARKLMNQFIGERDISAQEVSHALLNLPYSRSNRQVVFLNFNPLSDSHVHMGIRDGELRTYSSVLKKYIGRLTNFPELRDLTLWEWARKYDHTSYKPLKDTTPTRILCMCPRWKRNVDGQKENYYRAKMMLHHPFTDPDDLLIMDGIAYPSWESVFNACEANHSHPADYYHDPIFDESQQDPRNPSWRRYHACFNFT